MAEMREQGAQEQVGASTADPWDDVETLSPVDDQRELDTWTAVPGRPAHYRPVPLPPGTWPRRIGAIACLTIATLVTLLGVVLIIAAASEDSAIERHTGRADAAVVSVAYHRTLVRFKTPDGAEHMPSVGVLYPEALEEGQVVRVEYDTRNPDLVRVAGRGVTLTVLPVATTLIAVWAVAAGLVWWIRKKGPLFLRTMRAVRPSV